MGIRFHCPNGHKLNVKAFLAGKKGVCPDCGAKVRIPERSEPGLDSGQEDEADHAPFSQAAVTAALRSEALHSEAQQPTTQLPARPATMPPPSAPVGAPMTAVRPVVPAAPAPMAPAPLAAMPVAPLPTAMPTPMPAPMMATPAMPIGRPPVAPAVPVPPPPPPSSPPGVRDPIIENPLATWFVRPPSGGQFGPARGEVMRKWITEGRVTADSLVWREGWTDWLAATEVFPSLGKPAPLFNAASGPATSSIAVKKKSGGMGVAILIFLALICVALVAVLAVVLSGGLSST